MRRGRLRVGTSGWVYKHWRGPFYPADLPTSKWFAYYRERFDTVELNAPFYHIPQPRTAERWRIETPRDFTFAVKGSRFISHNTKLNDPEEPLERFFEVMDRLGAKMAVVLWQLPPSWGFNAERLDGFLRAFRARERNRRVCFEFRNPQWYAPESLAILRRWEAGFCVYELAGHASPIEVTADFAYVRLHGNAGRYAGEYGERGLAPWAGRIRGWLDAGIDCFAYFDNDHAAAAPRDAVLLRRMVDAESPRSAAARPQGLRRSRPSPRARSRTRL
jgi:uncharacterized protein YecE (DUF72 family)